MLKTRGKLAIVGGLAGLALLGLTSVPALAQTPASPSPSPSPVTPAPEVIQQMRERMNQMMDAVHGAGTIQRMAEAMGPDGEKMIDQCATMMGTMQNTQSGGGMMGL